MKKSYYFIERDQFWKNYWMNVGRDVDRISDSTVYPLFPINRYITNASKILEVGCGLGRVLKHYFYQSFDITGIDYDESCLKRLKEENLSLPVLNASITDLPYADETFDIVLAFGVIGHLENGMESALNETNRVLKQGGLLAGSLCIDNFARNVLNLINQIRYGNKNNCFYTWLFKRSEIWEVLERYNFELMELHPVITKSHFFMIPFFRKKNKIKFTYTEARDAETGYHLNALGNIAYSLASKVFNWNIAYTSSFVAIKKMGRKAI